MAELKEKEQKREFSYREDLQRRGGWVRGKSSESKGGMRGKEKECWSEEG